MSARENHPRLVAFLLGLAGGVLAVALTNVLIFLVADVAFSDGKCPRGQFPATSIERGGACFEDRTDLPTGYSADPGGNSGLD